MIVPAFIALAGIGSDAARTWLVPAVAACVPLLLFLLTRRSARADIVRGQATAVEQLYIGSAEKLLATLQDELRTRNGRIGVLESEREQLRSALAEERQCFEQVKQRQRDLVALMVGNGIPVPDELHV